MIYLCVPFSLAFSVSSLSPFTVFALCDCKYYRNISVPRNPTQQTGREKIVPFLTKNEGSQIVKMKKMNARTRNDNSKHPNRVRTIHISQP
uniref:Putative secreted peptide n=1 Tax=Anopheles braziliensis TaxID=58242 RepID=A0A2M3ZTD1_9DIPT